jgi:carboxyl-terminal processing protease
MKWGLRRIVAVSSYAGLIALIWSVDLGDAGLRMAPDSGHSAEAAETQSSRPVVGNFPKLVLMADAIGLVRNNYVEPERIQPRSLVYRAMQQVELLVPEVLVDAEGLADDGPVALTVRANQATRRFDITRVQDLYKVHFELKELLGFLDQHLPPDEPRSDIELAATNGMLQSLDPHSVLLSPEYYADMQVDTSGKFGGLGIVVSNRKGDLTVMTVMPKLPAARAGIKVGDKITQINDESTINMSIDEAVDRLRGSEGTEVTLWLQRKEWDAARPFTVTREVIKMPSVKSHDLGRGVGYIHLKSFREDTFDDLEAALAELEAKGSAKAGLVLDMRDNPGGLLDQAIRVSDLFLSDGTIVATVGNNGQRVREEKKARAAGTRSDLPVVVLVNNGSASASEIVTGALKNNDRAVILGNQTFGKGSVQVLYEVEDEEKRTAAVKLTVAQYLTPGDQSIQNVGITPDFLVYPVTLEPNAVDLYVSADDLMGESDLDNHLEAGRDGERARAIAGASVLRYYEGAAKRPENADDPEAVEPVTDLDAIEEDFHMHFARDLLLQAGSNTRAGTLARADSFLVRTRAEQDERIRSRLGELGVAWGQPQSDAKAAKVEVTLRTDRPNDAVEAGQTVKLVATAVHRGGPALGRLRAVTQSKNEAFHNLEMVFGALAPGETKTFAAEVELSASSHTRKDPVSIATFEDDTPLAATTSASIEVRELPRASTSFSWALDDVRGNGDGRLQKGEEVDLVVTLRNDGPGAPKSLIVNLRNESGRGVFLSQGKHRLEEGLAVGQTTTLRFAFRAQEYLDGNEAELAVSVLDTALREHATRTIRIPVSQDPPGAGGTASGWHGAAAGTLLRAHADVSAPVVGEVPSAGALRVLRGNSAWLAVEGPEGLPAWVQVSDTTGPIQLAARELAPPSPAKPRLVLQSVPPQIAIDAAVPIPLETTAPTLDLRGHATFVGPKQASRDIYVFCNEEKISFQSTHANEAPPTNTALPEPVSVPFSATVPLEPGHNTIRVFARQDRDTVETKILHVHRLPQP